MNKSPIHVLLTGASGTIGSEVMKQLVKRQDVCLTVFDVETPKTKKIFKPYFSKLKLVFGDLTQFSDVEAVVKNQDVVIHLAAIIPPLADEKPKLAYAVNVHGTENLLSALSKHSPDAFFMYSSSVSVYGDRVQNPNIKVSDILKPSPGDSYGLTKIECEERIQQSPLRWTIFRLGAIMKNHKISKLMFHMPLETTLEICTPEDVATAFINGIEKQEELKNRIFNLSGGKQSTISFKEFLQHSFQLFGLGMLNFPPHTFATQNYHCGYFADGDELEKILHFRNDDLKSYFEKTKKNIHPIKKILGTLFRIPIKKYLQLQSEPLKAKKNNDKERIAQFFGNG